MTLSGTAVLDALQPAMAVRRPAKAAAARNVALQLVPILPKVVRAYETKSPRSDIIDIETVLRKRAPMGARSEPKMYTQLFSLISHPTVITASSDLTGSFEGWGVRIGA
jgi:hypothetical protein